MEFDSSFVFAKPGPGEKRKAQIHDSRIKGVEFAFEAKPLLGGHSTAFCVQMMKNGFEELGRAVLIGIGKCGTFYTSYSQMEESAGLRSQLGGNVSRIYYQNRGIKSLKSTNQYQSLQWFPLKHLPISAISSTLLLWFLMIAKLFSFSYMQNEFDTIPCAKQFVEHDWLPNDWYLNLETGYRALFNAVCGNFISWLGFEYGTYSLRLLSYLLIAISLYTLFKSLRLRLPLGLLVLLLFLNHQSLTAGEWIVSGLETKPLCYAFAILSLSFLLRKNYLIGFAFAGAAMSFHVLVGGYAILCIAIATLLNKSWRSEWRIYITKCWPFFLTGYFGLQEVVKQLLQQSNMDTIKAWEIYVRFRAPHHVLPSVWGYSWIVKLALATGLLLIFYLMNKTRESRFIAAYALGSLSFFLIGLVLYSCGKIYLLKFYWFRFPDVMIPFMSILLIALHLNYLADERLVTRALPNWFQAGIRISLRLLVSMIIVMTVLVIGKPIWQSIFKLHTRFAYSQLSKKEDKQATCEWILKNTPKDATFLVDPTIQEFYIYAQRAIFVSWKHSPQSAADIVEWSKRIHLCNCRRPFHNIGFGALEELSNNFNNMSDDTILQIAKSYVISYYIGHRNQHLTFERVYSNSSFSVYKIDDGLLAGC